VRDAELGVEFAAKLVRPTRAPRPPPRAPAPRPACRVPANAVAPRACACVEGCHLLHYGASRSAAVPARRLTLTLTLTLTPTLFLALTLTLTLALTLTLTRCTRAMPKARSVWSRRSASCSGCGNV
jgi:hypothetical protein